MIMKKAFLITSLLCSFQTFAADAGDTFTQLLQKVNTYQASFEQSIKDAHGQPVSKSKGDVTISRPGKFYWKSATPDQMLIVADGKYLWTYDMDLSQVTKQNLDAVLKNSPAGLLAGSAAKFTEDFNISTAKNAQCHQKADQCFSLKPKEKDSPFANIYMGFTKGKLINIRMNDSLGQDVRTDFSGVKMNQAVNKGKFSFKPPAGVDIIQQAQ
jgi:outer membrane lipoprotein carrier protein